MSPTPRPDNAMRRLTLPMKFAAAALLGTVAFGCSHDAMLLESDVPVPSGMSTVRSADIRRSGGTVSGGRFVLAGPVEDAGSLMVATRERFAGAGWTTVEIQDGLDHASGTFRKGDRRVRLTIDRRALEPDMSSAMLEIGSGSDSGGGSSASAATSSPAD